MAFGDSLHKIHPLAGQGFNMILRDINILSKIIQDRIDLGLQIDHSIYEMFEKKTKHFNFIFLLVMILFMSFLNLTASIKIII